MANPATQQRVRLRPENPFDLIRLLARSQTDPRKAVAELAQNSLDANAREVEISWFNEAGQRVLRVFDDGEGIFPEMDRPEALRRIAQTIGHSHKRDLSPVQRRELMVLGKYGIGLIGFWSIGEVMEIRSRVGGKDPWCLQLVEDKSDGKLYRPRARRLTEEPTYTQITIRHLHEVARRQIRPARLQAYLAAELRGQLLRRDVKFRIRDRVARGRARKEFFVEARPFIGVPLTEFAELDVRGHEPARLELYLVSAEEERTGTVALACGGTTVLDDLAAIRGDEEEASPWSSGQLEGVVDYPDLTVSPGSRRGFVPDSACVAFFEALTLLETRLWTRLREEERKRAEQRNHQVARDIRRAFRSVATHLPEYDLFEVKGGSRGAPDISSPEGALLGEAEPGEPPSFASPAESTREAGSVEEEEAALFPPGPLSSVRLEPSTVRLAPGSMRSLRARALDAHGRAAQGAVRFQWNREGGGDLVPKGSQAWYTAPDSSSSATVRVIATQEDITAEATAEITVLEELAGREKVSGIPEPHPVHAPSEPWRSRMRGARWEFNDGHPDYLAVVPTESRRLRYLIHLFTKEVVLRNFGHPSDDHLLERMVQVLTHLHARSG